MSVLEKLLVLSNEIDKIESEVEELQKDKVRLDWVIENQHILFLSNPSKTDWAYRVHGDRIIRGSFKTFREAIDAAMKGNCE